MRDSIESSRQEDADDALGRSLTRALRTPAAYRIPSGFAARTTARAAAVPIEPGRYRKFALRGGFALLATGMVGLAPWAQTHAVVPVTVELLLVLEFAGLAAWMGLRPQDQQ